jgi:hypothetical protein
LSRVKTFDNTGLATAGRIYAGDLNSIEDHYADLYDLTQSFGASAIAIGESGLQLVRYGAGEARISGALRTDGIIRALGGLYAGAFTTTQRDAIAAGLAPYGLIILNTTTNAFEWNAGTDGARNWQFLDAPIVVATSVAGLGATYGGKRGVLRVGAAPYQFINVIFDSTYGKWVSAEDIVWSSAWNAGDNNAPGQIGAMKIMFTGASTEYFVTALTRYREASAAGLSLQFRAVGFATLVSSSGNGALQYIGISGDTGINTALTSFGGGTLPGGNSLIAVGQSNTFDSGWTTLSPAVKDLVGVEIGFNPNNITTLKFSGSIAFRWIA